MNKKELLKAIVEKAPSLKGQAFVNFLNEMQAMVMKDKKFLKQRPVQIIRGVYNRHFA